MFLKADKVPVVNNRIHKTSKSVDHSERAYLSILALSAANRFAKEIGKNPEWSYEPIPQVEPSIQTTIPPIIHFIWFRNLYHEHLDVSKIPESGSDAPRLCAAHNPNYEIKVWDADAARKLLEDHYPWFLPTYDSYRHPIQRVDVIKYFVLFHHGGIYMDLDIACRRPLDPLLDLPAWFPKASPLGVNCDLMASRARHPLLLHMLRELKPRNKNLLFPYITIFWSTGPQFASDMLRHWLKNPAYGSGCPNKKTCGTDKVYVLPLPFYSEEYTFFGHSQGGTWHGKDVAVVLWIVAHPWVLLPLPVIIFVAFLLYLRRRSLHRPKYTHRRGRRWSREES